MRVERLCEWTTDAYKPKCNEQNCCRVYTSKQTRETTTTRNVYVTRSMRFPIHGKHFILGITYMECVMYSQTKVYSLEYHGKRTRNAFPRARSLFLSLSLLLFWFLRLFSFLFICGMAAWIASASQRLPFTTYSRSSIERHIEKKLAERDGEKTKRSVLSEQAMVAGKRQNDKHKNEPKAKRSNEFYMAA